jgi:hypothetical protein
VTEHDHDHEPDHDHDHAHDHEHDEDDDYEPSSPEVLAERRGRLTTTLEAITVEHLNAHMQSAPEQVRSALTKRLSVRLDPRFIKGGVGRLIRTRLRGLSPTKQVEMAAELTAGLDHESSEFLGEAFAMPSREDLDRLVDHLLATHAPVIVRTYLACTAAADAPVADELDKILSDDARLVLAEA